MVVEALRDLSTRKGYALIENCWTARNATSNGRLPNGSYVWGTGGMLDHLEDFRQGVQNQTAWGTDHKKYHQALRGKLSDEVRNVVTFGVGWEAGLVKNLYAVYPQAGIHAVELNEERLKIAETSTVEAGLDSARLHYHPGDAATVLSALPRFDVVDVQLLFIHLTKTEMSAILEGTANKLAPEGILSVSDVLIRKWNVAPAVGFEENPEVQQLVADSQEFLHGNLEKGGRFPGAVEIAWGGRAHPWEDREKIAQTVTEYTNGRLVKITDPELDQEATENSFPSDSREALLAALIAPTIALSAQRGLGMLETRRLMLLVSRVAVVDGMFQDQLNKQFEQIDQQKAKMLVAINELFVRGPKFVEALRDPRILTVLPPMSRQAFRLAS